MVKNSEVFRVYFSKTNTVTLHRDIITNPNKKLSHSLKNENAFFDSIDPEQQQSSEIVKDKANNMDMDNLANNNKKDDDCNTDSPAPQLSNTKMCL